LESARAGLSRLKHLWVEAGYQGRGRKWAEEVMGLSVEVVRKPQKPVPEKIAKLWAQQWAKEGKEDGQGLREVIRHRGGLCLRGDEPPHGEAFGPCVGVSRQSL
jgi:hypothetical protein